MDHSTTTVPKTATDEVTWWSKSRDGARFEEDLWRASARVSPPVWMRVPR